MGKNINTIVLAIVFSLITSIAHAGYGTAYAQCMLHSSTNAIGLAFNAVIVCPVMGLFGIAEDTTVATETTIKPLETVNPQKATLLPTKEPLLPAQEHQNDPAN